MKLREVSPFPLAHGLRVLSGNQLESKVREKFEVVAICGEQLRALPDEPASRRVQVTWAK